MFEKTKQSYGVNEVLLASVLGAVVFSFLAAQPLVIVGVTGWSHLQPRKIEQQR
jgi:MFS superfamily sulfate permease-like transporter